jgi:serine/threonine protein kinase
MGSVRTVSPEAVPGTDPLGIVGSRVGERYQVMHCLGRGGMGTIYLARQENLEREVVVKVVQPDGDGDEVASRFHREARALSRLSHPNVVQVYDFGQEPNGLLYIVMEYVRGVTLARVLRNRRSLPLADFLFIADGLLAGLSEVHCHDLVHRDLKPLNVMLTTEGNEPRVKLLDFGLSKTNNSQQTVTRVHQLVGTAMYMAPEQLRGREVDARADVYAAGVLFYQMLTGARPFPAEEPHQVFVQQLQGEHVPMGEVLSQDEPVPAALVSLVERCLAVEPRERPRDAVALRRALARAVSDSGWTEPLRTSTTWFARLDSLSSQSHPPLRAESGQREVSSSSLGLQLERPTSRRGSRLGMALSVVLASLGLASLALTALLAVLFAWMTYHTQAPPGPAAASAPAGEPAPARALPVLPQESPLEEPAPPELPAPGAARASPRPPESPPPVAELVPAPAPEPTEVSTAEPTPPAAEETVPEESPSPPPEPPAVEPAPIESVATAPQEEVAPIEETRTGHVLIESPTLYGEVWVNERMVGFPPVRVELPVGPAAIQLRSGKSVRRTQQVVVEEGETRVVLR